MLISNNNKKLLKKKTRHSNTNTILLTAAPWDPLRALKLRVETWEDGKAEHVHLGRGVPCALERLKLFAKVGWSTNSTERCHVLQGGPH